MIQALARSASGMRELQPRPAWLRAALADPACILWLDLQAPAMYWFRRRGWM